MARDACALRLARRRRGPVEGGRSSSRGAQQVYIDVAVALSTGERFLRLHLSIWSRQRWVIDQELLPRIRRVMKAEGMKIPNGKISVFFHPRESRTVSSCQRRRDAENPAS